MKLPVKEIVLLKEIQSKKLKPYKSSFSFTSPLEKGFRDEALYGKKKSLN
ncbi:MAG: hypothetical protein ACKO1F_06405 [Flammeovirgaceae bacterium]